MKPILVFQTDFTYSEGAVPAMYGVVKSVDRELEIIDATHEIPQYDIWSASYRLLQYMRFWPEGTVFVSVVDPGVGTRRKACVARTADGYYVVTPDNGSLTHLKKWVGIQEVREIDETINRLRGKNNEGTNVFHGRDIFAYCAARLAAGIISYGQVGPGYDVGEIREFHVPEPEEKDGKIRGFLEIGDPNFGNVWTNIPLEMLLKAGFQYGNQLEVTIFHEGEPVFRDDLLFDNTFGCAEKGRALVYNNEIRKASIAVNQGSFSKLYGVGWGPGWEVEINAARQK